MQWFSAPLHRIGLNWYNQKDAAAGDRLQFVRSEYFKTALARSCRILPAFGIAPLINTPLRELTHSLVHDTNFLGSSGGGLNDVPVVLFSRSTSR